MIFASEILNSNLTFCVTWSMLYVFYVLGIEIFRGTVPGMDTAM